MSSQSLWKIGSAQLHSKRTRFTLTKDSAQFHHRLSNQDSPSQFRQTSKQEENHFKPFTMRLLKQSWRKIMRLLHCSSRGTSKIPASLRKKFHLRSMMRSSIMILFPRQESSHITIGTKMNLTIKKKFSSNRSHSKCNKNQSRLILVLKLTLQYKKQRHLSTSSKPKWIRKQLQ